MQRWNVCIEGGSCSRNWKLYKLREEILAGLENNLSGVAEFLGELCVFVRAACVPTRASCCEWSVRSHSGTGPRVTALPLSSLGCRLTASWALKGPWWQNGGLGMPSLSFCKSKAALCPYDRALWPLPHLRATFSRLSQEHIPPSLLPLLLRCCWGCCCFIPLSLHDRQHQYCSLTYRAMEKEMGIFTVVSDCWYSGLRWKIGWVQWRCCVTA